MTFSDIIRRSRRNIVAFVSIFNIFTIAFAQTSNQEGSYLHISQPASLKDSFGLNGVAEHPAMFGIPAYGHGTKISGILVFPQPGNFLACQPIKKEEIFYPSWPTTGIVILVVDRGNCTFVTKVRNCQQAGANGVIIVDNLYQRRFPYMADDETGHYLTIPSMFIRRADGDTIKKTMRNDTVVVVMSWLMPSPDGRVELDLWTSSDDDVSFGFKQEFKKVVEVLGDAALFIPHYFIRNGRLSGCTSQSLPCYTQCSNSGRYCTLDPDRDMSIGLSGGDVIQENLRQICLWEYLNQTGQTLKWWDYVVQFEDVCNANAENTWTVNCSQMIMSELGIASDVVFQCVANNGGADYYGGPNVVLDNALEERNEMGINILPTLIINDLIHYRGSLACPAPIDVTSCGVLQAVCAGYKIGTEPRACISAPGCGVGIERDVCGVCGGNGAFDSCRRCLPKNDPKFKINGTLDTCGNCLNSGSNILNHSCLGCDGVIGSTKKFDPCGDCIEMYDPQWGKSCAITIVTPLVMPLYVYIIIVVGAMFILVLLGILAMRERERRMRRSIDSLLKQYLPLDAKNQPLPNNAAEGDINLNTTPRQTRHI